MPELGGVSWRIRRSLLHWVAGVGFIAIVLSEQAYGLAMTSLLPAAIKKLLSEARPDAESRGNQFSVRALGDLPMITELVEIKTTPREKVGRRVKGKEAL